MRTKILVALLLSLFLLSASLVPLSQAESVGVNVGDWFEYEGALVKWEADEGVPFPPNSMFDFLKTWNESDWQRRTVTAVTGTTITYEVLTHYKNGTEETKTMDEDVTSGFTVYSIGANLGPGDQVRPASFGPAMIINETITREYYNMTRETNYCEWTATIAGTYTHDDLYWDKETGILVEWLYNGSISMAEGNANYSLPQKLTNTNLWIVPEFSTGTVMLLILVAATVCVSICRPKMLKHRIG